jgi:hypothetical protein
MVDGMMGRFEVRKRRQSSNNLASPEKGSQSDLNVGTYPKILENL